MKICVDADNGPAWGTGTIIDTRRGPEGQEALILTCGHIFRGWQQGKNIEVHLYGENSTIKVLGLHLLHDLDVDLALIAIAPPSQVRAVPIAPPSYVIQPLQQAWSVGCDHGANPTVWTHQVMSIDKMSEQKQNGTAFHFVQVSGAPVGGRSGGGLFSSEGYLIGVCVTGCPTVNEGYFVPPHMIRHVLDSAKLSHIHQNPSLGAMLAQTLSQTPPALAALAPLQTIESLPMASLPTALPGVPMPMYAEHRTGMSREERATLEEIERRKQGGDEVIVIVRSLRNPENPSDVIVLNDVSSLFLNELLERPSAVPADE